MSHLPIRSFHLVEFCPGRVLQNGAYARTLPLVSMESCIRYTMKNFSSLASLGLLWLISLISATDGTIVRWTDGTEHDFGRVRLGHTFEHRFVFENIAGQAIALQTVRTDCGCTAADWPEEPIAPGQRGEIRIEFHADRGGSFRKKIKVYFDRQRRAEILWIYGEVENEK